MLRATATWLARWKYIWNKESEAGLNEWSARVAEQRAKDSRDLIVKLTNDADELEARIKQMAEMKEKGFWLCEDGHEKPKCMLSLCDEHEEMQCKDCKAESAGNPVTCDACDKPMRLIKRDLMTGQEKYDSDKGRKDAEKMLAARRQEITDKETEAGQQEATAKYFRQQSVSARTLAESLRNL
jgi:hypothetical protein